MSMLRVLLRDPSHCPYYRGFNRPDAPGRDVTCRSGCWSEPSCITDEPLNGWPFVRLLASGRKVASLVLHPCADGLHMDCGCGLMP
jgi:hypothetical protein